MNCTHEIIQFVQIQAILDSIFNLMLYFTRRVLYIALHEGGWNAKIQPGFPALLNWQEGRGGWV
jgi:hypothetical protein